jgi:hypothetical protein
MPQHPQVPRHSHGSHDSRTCYKLLYNLPDEPSIFSPWHSPFIPVATGEVVLFVHDMGMSGGTEIVRFVLVRYWNGVAASIFISIRGGQVARGPGCRSRRSGCGAGFCRRGGGCVLIIGIQGRGGSKGAVVPRRDGTR